MYLSNANIKESLQDALREYNSTDLNDESSVHFLLGYLKGTIEETILMVDRIEQDKKYEKYRQQEEAEFNSHLGRF
jgi:hypothetical protein